MQVQELNLGRKRVRDDLEVNHRAGGLDQDSDVSMDTNTDFFKPKKVKKVHFEGSEYTLLRKNEHQIEVAETDEQIDAHQFYEQSLYFVDTLQQEFCHVVGDNWLEFKEPVSIESIEPYSKTLNEGHWSVEEHCLFLEALKLYGKDWEQIEQHVGTRDVKNIRAHSQKYLMKLVKMLEGGTALKGLSQEEAEYFYGILSKKTHRSVKAMIQKEEEQRARERTQKLFKVEREARPKPFCSKSELMWSGQHPKTKEQYEVWRELASQGQSKNSVGFSIRTKVAPLLSQNLSSKPTLCKFSFRSIMKNDIVFDDTASDDSDALRKQLKYDVDMEIPAEYAASFGDQQKEVNECLSKIVLNMIDLMNEKGDFPERGMQVILRVGHSNWFNLSDGASKKVMIAELHSLYCHSLVDTMPNYAADLLTEIEKYLDNIEDYDHSDSSISEMEKYFYSQMTSAESREKLLAAPLSLRYISKEEWREIDAKQFSEVEQLEFLRPEDALELLPNSKQGLHS